MSFTAGSESDEQSIYECERFSESTSADIKQPHGEIRYWVGKRSAYANLSRVALWLIATPVPSTPSKRSFRFLNRFLTADRNRLKDDILEDIIFVKSFLDFTARMEGQSVWCDFYLQ